MAARLVEQPPCDGLQQMNATRLSTDPLAPETRDFTASRPVLSGGSSGGLLSGLLRALLPFRSGGSKATAPGRAEPRLRATQSESVEAEGNTRREPYLMAQRRPTLGAAD